MSCVALSRTRLTRTMKRWNERCTVKLHETSSSRKGDTSSAKVLRRSGCALIALKIPMRATRFPVRVVSLRGSASWPAQGKASEGLREAPRGCTLRLRAAKRVSKVVPGAPVRAGAPGALRLRPPPPEPAFRTCARSMLRSPWDGHPRNRKCVSSAD